MSIPHLNSKLNIPPQRPNLVLRPRLTARLEEGQHQRNRLTLISAKAGSGKTTLVSEWVHQQKRPAAWLSLDASDNDPRRFFSYLVAALNEVGIKISQSILSQLESPQLPQIETLFTELINNVAADLVPFLIVLDDYHFIQNDWIHQAVEFLIEYQPDEFHLICITRVDPPLPLARLRARGQISEIRDNDLCFTSEEVAQFFNQVMELNLPVEAISTLEGRTEGWIAGLQLAAISVRGYQQDGDQAAFIKAFGGSNRFILDYLMEEVLTQQSPVIQDFLIETAILERMCGDLCDAVNISGAEKYGDLSEVELQMRGSQTILEKLERNHLFVIPLDEERRWYRYHHLFADLLTSTLKQRKSEQHIQELHRRASRWHQREGNLEEAMSHAMAAQDYEQAALMIDENIASMLSRNEVPVLLGWIEKLPEHVVHGRPWIDVHRANTLVLTGQPEDVGSLLEDIEKRIEPDAPRSSELLGHMAAVRAYAANLAGDAARATEMAALAEKHLPDDHVTGQSMTAYTLADIHFSRDDMDGTSQSLLKMLRVGEKSNELMMIVPALCELAVVKKTQGQLHQAMELYDKAYQWLEDQDSLDYRLRCSYEFGMAELLREWNQLDAAYKHAMIGDEYRQRLGGYLMVGELTLMRVLQARGDVKGALDALYNAEQIKKVHQFQLAINIEFKTERVVQWLAAGDVETASRWAEECNGGSEREQIVLARLRLAQGQVAEAKHLLDRQRGLAEAGGRYGRLIEILGLQALALSLADKSSEAVAVLSQALSLARPEGYVRIFLDLGQPIYDLLEKIVSQGTAAKKHSAAITSITEDYARDLLKVFRHEDETQTKGGSQALVSPLTNRELEVLRLLAEGLSNKAIADRLVVAPSTVKQHLKNIFSKLDVHNRTQAVARGQELELL